MSEKAIIYSLYVAHFTELSCMSMNMSVSRVLDPTAPMHLGLKAGHLCPLSNQGSPEALLKLQMAPMLILWLTLGSKKKESRYACLSEAKASHSQRIWAEVSSITSHFLQNGLSSSPSR